MYPLSIKSITRNEMQITLKEYGVTLIGSDLHEAPMAYKAWKLTDLLFQQLLINSPDTRITSLKCFRQKLQIVSVIKCFFDK